MFVCPACGTEYCYQSEVEECMKAHENEGITLMPSNIGQWIEVYRTYLLRDFGQLMDYEDDPLCDFYLNECLFDGAALKELERLYAASRQANVVLYPHAYAMRPIEYR